MSTPKWITYYDALSGNGSINTLPRRRNDVTPQQWLAITSLVFSVWSAPRNNRTVFSALSVPRLYNTSPLAAKKSFSWVPRFQGKKWQEDVIFIWSVSFWVEIRCQETTSEDEESQCVYNDGLESV
jgi:hypothetical protein